MWRQSLGQKTQHHPTLLVTLWPLRSEVAQTWQRHQGLRQALPPTLMKFWCLVGVSSSSEPSVLFISAHFIPLTFIAYPLIPAFLLSTLFQPCLSLMQRLSNKNLNTQPPRRCFGFQKFWLKTVHLITSNLSCLKTLFELMKHFEYFSRRKLLNKICELLLRFLF